MIDRQAEAMITARLKDIAPDIVPIGEESVAAHPGLLDEFYRGAFQRCWLIDPLDGTGNFITGDDRFAIMVTLVDRQVAVASWMFEPVSGRMAICERGSGAYLNGRRIRVAERPVPRQLRGCVLDRFLPPPERQRIEGNLDKVTREPGSKCAGWDYASLATGALDFVLYWRLLPWDHAPGALFLTEAGGCVRHFDATPYEAASQTSGLIAAATETAWRHTHDALLITRP